MERGLLPWRYIRSICKAGGTFLPLKLFSHCGRIWYAFMKACLNFSILPCWTSLDWGETIMDAVAHIPQQTSVNKNGTRTTARETLHSTSKKLNYFSAKDKLRSFAGKAMMDEKTCVLSQGPGCPDREGCGRPWLPGNGRAGECRPISKQQG